MQVRMYVCMFSGSESMEGSLWWERSVKEVGLEPGVQERGSYGRWEWWVDRV